MERSRRRQAGEDVPARYEVALLNRDGQTFFVHNRVESIYSLASLVQKLVRLYAVALELPVSVASRSTQRSADAATPETIAFMAREARGLICLALGKAETVSPLPESLKRVGPCLKHPVFNRYRSETELRYLVGTGVSAAAIDCTLRAERKPPTRQHGSSCPSREEEPGAGVPGAGGAGRRRGARPRGGNRGRRGRGGGGNSTPVLRSGDGAIQLIAQ